MRAVTIILITVCVGCVGGVVACDKGPSPGPISKPTDTASAAPTTSASVATPEASSLASATASAPTPTTTASAAAAITADGGKAAAAATKDAGGHTPTAGLKPASKHLNGKNFALDLTSPGCKAAEECAMTIKLVATGDYHVNKEYPYKFVGTPAPGITFLGKGDGTFAKDRGDYVENGEKSGTLTIRFKPAAAGDARVAGTYKLSVCSADLCQIEQQQVELAIPVL